MNVLGFDTATAATAVCLLRADGDAFEIVPPPEALGAPPAHARELMPGVMHVLEQGGLSFGELDALAVGIGPGTFTGLRIGIATARAIASARSLPVHPVSSLGALAAGADTEAGDRAPVLAAIDARRRELYAALHERDGSPAWPPFVAAPAVVAARLAGLGEAPLAVGDGAIRFRAELEAGRARVAPDGSPVHVVRALHVCRLARGAPAAAPEAVLPDYVRGPDAAPRAFAPSP